MSIIRTALVLAAVVMVLPGNRDGQGEATGASIAGPDRAQSFCERNPGTCAAGRELWTGFLRKAELGMDLATGLVRKELARASEQRPQPTYGPTYEPAYAPPRAAAEAPPEAYRDDASTAPGRRGTLTSSDLAPQWRGGIPPQAAR